MRLSPHDRRVEMSEADLGIGHEIVPSAQRWIART
jgi:hypothetical protein